MAGVSKVTTVDSPEKMRSQTICYSIVIPQVREEPSKRKDLKTEQSPKSE